ncbi:hypothetical protein HPB48_000592 [Haemaphysalis longicornis]|uniref:THAP-type domain-containing protein n=1 Tax=Haemaphysalis longicornis TaxID=44386 RepID=A0A9J6FWC3_HAELO|nr:hypothetical protein HPB48_000592 [Haemaphysalis longicornis]
MVYCCVSLCKSQQGKTPGVSYHQFPSHEELCSKRRKNVSRENLVINDKYESTVVCSKHFTESDCSRMLYPEIASRSLRSVSHSHSPSVVIPRSSISILRIWSWLRRGHVKNLQLVAPRPPRLLASRLSGKRSHRRPPSTYGKCAPLEEFTDERCSTSTQTSNNDAKLASRYLTIVKRLRSQVAYQRSKCRSLAQQLAREQEKVELFHEDKHCTAVKKIVTDTQNGDKKAVFLRHQIEVYGMERPSYSEEVIRRCVIWRFISLKGYNHA